MSRIGKMQIILPKGVEVSVSVQNGQVFIKGPKGEMNYPLPQMIELEVSQDTLQVRCAKSADIENQKGISGKKMVALYGAWRARLANDIIGVTSGWSKTLEMSGVGYRASLNGVNLVLNVGFSHPVSVEPAAGIVFSITEGKIIVSGIDKHLVGQVAADIRSIKKPEPYKGKGIKYASEHIRKKAGKAAKAVGAPGAAGAK